MKQREETTLLLLPTTSSECSIEGQGESLQHDVLLSSHPLLPHLQELLQGNKEHPLFVNPNLASGLTCGVSEVDDTLLQAVAQAVNLCRGAEACAQVRRIDQESGRFVGDTRAFCQKLLADTSVDLPSVSTSVDLPSVVSTSVDLPSVSTPNQADENVNTLNTSHIEDDLTSLDRKPHKPLPKPIQKESVPLKKRKRTVISQKSTQILKLWLFDHSNNPYPDDDEKDELCLRTNLTIYQLNLWFANARKRILRPYLKKIAAVGPQQYSYTSC